MNNVTFYEKCFKMKVVDLNESRIALLWKQSAAVCTTIRCEEKWKCFVQFTQGLCGTGTDQNVILPSNLVRIANTEFRSHPFNSPGGKPCTLKRGPDLRFEC
jgi:hypothetical protein